MYTRFDRISISVYILIFLMTACVSHSDTTVVSLANETYSTTYQFTGDSQNTSNLQLTTSQEDVSYSAQVSNFAGKIIATVNDTNLSNIELTIPIGEQQYYVTIASEREDWLDHITITVNPTHNETESAYIPIAFSQSTTTCEIWTDQDGAVNLFAQPLATTQMLLTLPTNIPFIADARTRDGWYRLAIDNTIGWVNGNLVNLSGNCVGLPVDTMIQPTVAFDNSASAPYDVDRHYFAIDINDGAIFTNAVSYPNGDSSDVIQATLSNTHANRTIGVVMTCNGTGVDALRWGLSQDTTLSCGDTLELGFLERSNDLFLTVMLPAVSGQQYVEYQLTAMPIAPADDLQHVMAVDRNEGGILQERVSFPSGDSQDDIAIYIQNLADISPNNFRQVTLVMRCNGNAPQNLRWGNTETIGGCNDTITISLTHEANVQPLRVWIPETVEQSFIEYALYALPSAPADENYSFSIDRDYGGTFSESISAPLGDLVDNIQIMMPNLTTVEPNNLRDMHMTMYCEGANIENIRWGLPGNPTLLCGQTINATFTNANRQQNIEVISNDINASTYVNYTLVIVRVQPEPTLQENPVGG